MARSKKKRPLSQQLAALRGKKIARVRLNRFSDGRGGWAFDPVIELHDGSVVCFDVQEIDGDGYGVTPIVVRP